MPKRSKKPVHQVKIAKERISLLFEEARKVVRNDAKLSQRYASLARKIGMRYNVRLTAEQKRHVCRKCHAYLLAGATSQHKVKGGKVSIRCMACGHVASFQYK